MVMRIVSPHRGLPNCWVYQGGMASTTGSVGVVDCVIEVDDFVHETSLDSQVDLLFPVLG